jgi:hypothetical protein
VAATRGRTLLGLHALLALYSLCSICGKLAAGFEFMSPGFILCYGSMILVLGLYAIGWQQVIKRMPLTSAYANKAVTIVWGIVWGVLLFHEAVTRQAHGRRRGARGRGALLHRGRRGGMTWMPR